MGDVSSWKAKKSIHVLAVDGIVSVNSLFTVAVFLGLAFADPKTTLVTADDDVTCIAGASVAERLITRHVYSFSSFLFSSLIASALKQALKTANPGAGMRSVTSAAHVNVVVLRVGMVVSAVGSVFGCGFLMFALVDLVEIKLGILRCWSVYSLAAIVPLVTLIPSALVIYVCIVIYAFMR